MNAWFPPGQVTGMIMGYGGSCFFIPGMQIIVIYPALLVVYWEHSSRLPMYCSLALPLNKLQKQDFSEPYLCIGC